MSDETGLGVVPATPAGRLFRDELGRLNQALAAESEEAELVVAGRVLPLGEWLERLAPPELGNSPVTILALGCVLRGHPAAMSARGAGQPSPLAATVVGPVAGR